MLEHQYLPQRSHLLPRFNYYVNVAFPKLSVPLPAVLLFLRPLLPLLRPGALPFSRLSPDVLNYFIRYYSPPTTVDRTHSIRQPRPFHSIPFGHIVAGLSPQSLYLLPWILSSDSRVRMKIVALRRWWWFPPCRLQAVRADSLCRMDLFFDADESCLSIFFPCFFLSFSCICTLLIESLITGGFFFFFGRNRIFLLCINKLRCFLFDFIDLRGVFLKNISSILL